MATPTFPEMIRLETDTGGRQGLADELADYRRQIGEMSLEEAATTQIAYKVIVLSRLLHDGRVGYNAVCSDSTIEYAEHLEPVLLQQAYQDIYLFVASVRVTQQTDRGTVLARMLGPIVHRFQVRRQKWNESFSHPSTR